MNQGDLMPRALTRPRYRRGILATAVLAALSASAATLPASAAQKRTGHAVGTLKGHTAQGLPVSLSGLHPYGRAFRYQATMSCSDGSSFTDDPFTDDVKVSANGNFHSAYVSDGGATSTHVRGRILGRRASGVLRIVEFYSNVPDANGYLHLQANGPVRCDSGNVNWTAA
jgi:hypothetical protein